MFQRWTIQVCRRRVIFRALETFGRTRRCRLDNLPFGCSIVDVMGHLARGLCGILQTMQRP